MKRLSVLLLILALLVPALLLVGCAGTAGPSDRTYKEINQERSDEIVIRQETTRTSDGSEVICTIATGSDINTMDCVVVRYDSEK